MRIELVKHWNSMAPGSVLEVGQGVGELLLVRGIAVAKPVKSARVKRNKAAKATTTKGAN